MTENTEIGTAITTKPVKGKAPKGPAKAKTAAPRATRAVDEKSAKSKREKTPKENLMTFAFRMPKAESAALHAAAGPANASRTMRALAAAFVTGDRAAFEAVVEDAKKLR